MPLQAERIICNKAFLGPDCYKLITHCTQNMISDANVVLCVCEAHCLSLTISFFFRRFVSKIYPEGERFLFLFEFIAYQPEQREEIS